MSNILYHYCSIETFELIMKYKTIRFSSLGVVDDIEESLTSDYEDIGKICFVSCWTDLIQESVDMWRTYAGKENGVRIGLPMNFFEIGVSDSELSESGSTINERNDIFLSPPCYPELMPVTYTKDDSLINLSVLNINDNSCEDCGKKSATLSFNTTHLGRFKREYWSGQSEWRYRLIAVPQEYYRNNNSGRYLGEPEEMVQLMKSDLVKMPFMNNHIDFPFKEEVFEEMEIVLSPLNTAEDNDKVKSIIEKYTNLSNLDLRLSDLKIRKQK
ncbi:DUF2971 domain-containing protein (plasmid) [Alkalihalophilus sp. As8PL]|uniref:DUF2971 domain-containing protein n=1 Tax=Alkalihalophilus sp. As8PL TaxID=3237103 RepID=A0AB39BNM1_9BACI